MLGVTHLTALFSNKNILVPVVIIGWELPIITSEMFVLSENLDRQFIFQSESILSRLLAARAICTGKHLSEEATGEQVASHIISVYKKFPNYIIWNSAPPQTFGHQGLIPWRKGGVVFRAACITWMGLHLFVRSGCWPVHRQEVGDPWFERSDAWHYSAVYWLYKAGKKKKSYLNGPSTELPSTKCAVKTITCFCVEWRSWTLLIMKISIIPIKSHFSLQDDAANDPQWSEEQIIEVKFKLAGLEIGQTEVDIMAQSTRAIFEILEKAWQPQNCTLVDLKVRTFVF